MWICKNCGTENGGNARFCSGCGKTRDEVELPLENGTVPQQEDYAPATPVSGDGGAYWAPADPAGWAPPAPVKKKSYWWLWLLGVVFLLVAAAVVGYFTIHIWTPATCTEATVCKICGKRQGAPLGHAFSEATCTAPQTCSRCGLTQGEALGHSFLPASCTEPETCSRCGETRGEPLGHSSTPPTCTEAEICRRCGETLSPPLGHDWVPATYDEPETCSRCGETRGELKGYIGSLSGSMGSESLYLYSNSESHAYLLNEPVSRCRYMILNLTITEYTGTPFGTWGVYGRDLSGKWQLLTTIYVSRSVYNEWTEFELYLDNPSFDALSLVPHVDGDYSFSYSFYYSDAQVTVD